MTYEEWMKTVPQEIKDDSLWRMEVYRLSLFAEDLAWPDTTKLILLQDPPMPPDES